MTRTRFEVVPPPMSTAAAPGPAAASGLAAIVAGFIVFALVAGASWMADRQLRRFLSELDEQLLGQASASLEQLLARQREQLVAEVKVLADDNRIRATVLAPVYFMENLYFGKEQLAKGVYPLRRPRGLFAGTDGDQ